jgi:hypothetical protein
MIDIEKMKQAALSATQGEWDSYETKVYLSGTAGGFDLGCSPNAEANADFIATANPSAVLELIARLEAAEQDAAENQRLSHDAIRALARIDEALGIGEGENDSEGFADLDTTLEEIHLLKAEARRGKALAIAVMTDQTSTDATVKESK